MSTSVSCEIGTHTSVDSTPAPGRIAAVVRFKEECIELEKHGYSAFNRSVIPDWFPILDDPERFREINTFAGIEADFYYRILEWTGK